MSSWLRLMRVALAPSVLWDGIAGAVLAHAVAGQSLGTAVALPLGTLAATLAVLLCVFHAGMIWNDWADRSIDRAAGRGRPLVDGRISPVAALTAGAALMATAALLAVFALPDARPFVLALIGLVAVYDFGGKALRLAAGPLLLAFCRAISLSLGMLVVLAPGDLARLDTIWPICSYAVYLLFLSRLATREEEGGPGMRLISMAVAAPIAPVLLFQMETAGRMVPLAIGWLLFWAWAARPAVRDRHLHWSPERVQGAVRHLLVGMPWVPALALLASPAAPWWVLGGGATTFLVGRLARRFPPS